MLFALVPIGDQFHRNALSFIGSVGVEGGQGNSDSIYGSHDDHDTFGVSGSGWQGPGEKTSSIFNCIRIRVNTLFSGNGEAPGDLWVSLFRFYLGGESYCCGLNLCRGFFVFKHIETAREIVVLFYARILILV